MSPGRSTTMLLLTPSGMNCAALSPRIWTAGATLPGSAAVTGVERPSNVMTISAAEVAVRMSVVFVMDLLLRSASFVAPTEADGVDVRFAVVFFFADLAGVEQAAQRERQCAERSGQGQFLSLA